MRYELPYAEFDFYLDPNDVVDEWEPHYFSFLPPQALPLIHRLDLDIVEDWTESFYMIDTLV